MVTSHREQLARLRLNTELVANKFTSVYALNNVTTDLDLVLSALIQREDQRYHEDLDMAFSQLPAVVLGH